MHINKIEIENFRSIKDKITIHAGDSNFKAFVGANNTGKSNVLRAINLFFNRETEPGMQFNAKKDFHIGHKAGTGKVSIEFQFSKSRDKAITNFIDKHNLSDFSNYIVPVSMIYGRKAIKQYSFTVSRGRKKNLENLLNMILEYVNCVYIPAIKNYKTIINTEMMRKIVAATFHNWGRGILTTQKLRDQKQKFQKVLSDLQGILDTTGSSMTELMNSVIPSIKRFDFSLPYDNLEDFLGKLIFEISEEGLPDKVLLDSEGSGIQSFTIYSMLKLLHELRPKSTYKKAQLFWLIEEPETFMHHDLQRKTFNKLLEYSKEGPIFISTHSPVFIDKDSYKNSYHVTKSTPTRIKPINSKSILNVIAGNLGVSFRDFFIFNKLNVLVEGETDKDLLLGLNKLIKKSGSKDFLDIENIELISCGSVNTIPHFYNMYNVFNRYADFIALFDRDKRAIETRDKMIKNGIDKSKLLLIPKSGHRNDPEIEDLVDKSIWDFCLNKLDDDGLISLKQQRGKIIGYEYLQKDRVAVKTNFCKYLLGSAAKDLGKFKKYQDLIKNIKSVFDKLISKK
ncbi:ATP-dependent endonuclease [Candidatus Margulisiibacteriota bacterium]